MSAAIRVRELRKSYGKRSLFGPSIDAVQGLNLEIGPGEIWALAGPNGAGKSTTFHCLLGFLVPDEGTVEIFGEDPRGPEVRRAVGFQSEIFFSYAYRTAFDALRFYGRLSGMNLSSLDSRVEKVLNLVGLEEVKQHKVRTFSKGMMQRLGLAQSILHDPKLIIWDEPSTGLDPAGRRLVADLLLQFKSEKKSVILSTHILSDIEKVCDHIAIIKKGKIIFSGGMEELLKNKAGQTLEDVYLNAVEESDDVE